MSFRYGQREEICGQGTGYDESQNPQDWVCLKCHNLNFSFRKRCNRCKLQSREENQMQYADYYHHYFRQFSSQGSLHASSCYPTVQSPRQAHSSRRRQNDVLPSVSPLLRRSEFKKRGAGRQKGVWNVFGEEVWESEENTLWVGEESDSESEKSLELLRSVQRMIL